MKTVKEGDMVFLGPQQGVVVKSPAASNATRLPDRRSKEQFLDDTFGGMPHFPREKFDAMFDARFADGDWILERKTPPPSASKQFEIAYERVLLVKMRVQADSEEAARARYKACDFTVREVTESVSKVTEETLLTIKEVK